MVGIGLLGSCMPIAWHCPKARSPEYVAEQLDDKEPPMALACSSSSSNACVPVPSQDRLASATISTGCAAQMIERIPLVPQLGKLVAKGTSGRAGSVQGKPPLSGWAKAQAMMVYAQEHEERWVHNGFLQVGLHAGARPMHAGIWRP